jgi:hypothetical protein
MKLKGQWEGYYEYGAGYTLPYFGQRVKMTVSFEGTNDRFKGSIEEEETEFSVPHPATIQGFCEEDYISFVKTYPVHPFIEEDGESVKIDKNDNLEVDYQGYIDEENKALYGSWTIGQLFTDENGQLQESICEGIWMLKPCS